MNILRTLCASIVALCVLAFSAPLLAGDNPNLLVMGEDGDKDTVPRSSRVFKRVLDALNEEMHNAGFNMYDETAITLGDFAQGRSRRTDAEIIDVARSVRRPPIDVAVIFQIYASAKPLDHTTKVKVRISGRMLNVKTGQRLGNFEVDTPQEWNAEPECNRECILEVVGNYSKTIAADLGAVLAEKLAWMVEGDSDGSAATGESQLPMAFNLIFDGFTPDDMLSIEEYIVIFSGYKSHRPVYSSARRSEIWYESTIKSAKLNRNLQKMLKELDLSGMVQFAGNTYSVKKIARRNETKKPDTKDGW
ncbi:hypothetical protein [Ketobacter alkanivorans]|uniref:Flagellar assembly protein T N-terminal domain-containing protein n=1 Tax=Ketobacter alkanivorans TaxID=1917421 RepID=A0A2K9LQR8_9GAMM|nr:hypothetical protein [Ketobacter alkanivorans]AUM13164.1 hypothetical protein Kalk_12325 [Ketobacter alkanivorans]